MALVWKAPNLTSYLNRAALYNQMWPTRPPLVVHFNVASGQTWLYGIWEIGNDYRNPTEYYGAYPNSYVERVLTMFPDMDPAKTLHLFAGSYKGPGIKVDILHHLKPTIQANAEHLPFPDATFQFVMADPPYSEVDAAKYGSKLPYKKMVMRELARVVKPGGHVAWLDIPKPMYRKTEWIPWGTIGILRSINHRGQFLFLYQRR